MASSIESKLEKLHSLCLVLGEDFEELSQKELGGPPYNHQYSTNLDLLLERKSDLKNFRLTEARSLASRVLDYWDVLSVPVGERKGFTDLFCWIDSVPNDLINEPCQLSSSVIQDMIAELDRVEDICMDKLSEQLKVLDECKKLAGLYVPKPENHQSIQEDDDDEDPIASLRSVTAQIEGMKKEISSRGSIVTRAVIVLNAVDEVNWFQSYNYRAQALSDANHDMHGRAVKAQKLSLKITEMLDDLKDKVEDWKAAEGSSFMYNGGDLSAIVVGCKKKLTEAPEVAINLQLHPAHMEDPEVQIDPQPQQFEAPADGGVIPPHNPIDMDFPGVPTHVGYLWNLINLRVLDLTKLPLLGLINLRLLLTKLPLLDLINLCLLDLTKLPLLDLINLRLLDLTKLPLHLINLPLLFMNPSPHLSQVALLKMVMILMIQIMSLRRRELCQFSRSTRRHEIRLTGCDA